MGCFGQVLWGLLYVLERTNKVAYWTLLTLTLIVVFATAVYLHYRGH